MLNTLKSRIFLFFAGILILTSAVTALIVKNETEKAMYTAIESQARNLADSTCQNINSSYRSIMYYKEALLEIKKNELQNVVSIVFEILEHYNSLAQKGQFSMERAKKEASDTVRVIKFEKGTGYIWLNDTRDPLPYIIVHPIMPELEGKPLLDPELADAAGTGKNFVRILADTALAHGEGFLEYSWPRPDDKSLIVSVPKLSFVRLFKPWSWVIGSGVYIDDINAEVEKKKQSVIQDLTEMMAGIRIGETGYMFLFNGNLEVLAHPYLKGRDISNIISSNTGNQVIKDIMTAAKEGREEYTYLWEYDNDESTRKPRWKKAYIRYIEPLDWYLVASIYIDELSRPAKELGIKILLISLFFITVSSFISFHLSKTLSQPLTLLADSIHRAEKERQFSQAAFPVAGTDETRKLGNTLNSLVNAILSYKKEADGSREKFSRLVENLNEKYIFFSSSPDGTITFASKSLENMTGYTMEEFTPLFKTLSLTDGILKPDACWDQGVPVTFETEFTHKNRNTIYFEITEVPVYDSEGKLLYFDGIIKDITDKKINEEKLRQAQKMETIGILAGGLAHDFNNLLGGIIGPASLIRFVLGDAGQEKSDNDCEKINNYLSMIEESGNKAAEIVRQLMTISREQKINTSEVNLATAVSHVYDICSNTFDKSVSINVSTNVDKPVIQADKTQIEQVILNLCVNSYHAMTTMRPNGQLWGGQLSINISSVSADNFFRKTHPEAESRDYYMLAISDTGIGIARENISSIFTPFFTTKKETEGTGLGLTMTYNIVKQHKGFIDVYSEPEAGTTFKVYLPVSTQEEKADSNAENTAAPETGKGLILVIDDEEIIRDVAKEILVHCGYEVITAGNSREGVEKYRAGSSQISAVLLDMAMPEMSGRETYLMLREINPYVRVVLASGNRNDKRVNETLSLGVRSFLEKPYTMGRLSGAISEVIKSG